MNSASATRLNATPHAPHERERPSFGQPGVCLECGGPFQPRQRDAEFCASPCRQAWNNRRLVRGAELLDLFMALRFDRKAATGLHVFTALCRLASSFRREDAIERAGRRSWSPPARIISRKPYLRAERLSQQRERS